MKKVVNDHIEENKKLRQTSNLKKNKQQVNLFAEFGEIIQETEKRIFRSNNLIVNNITESEGNVADERNNEDGRKVMQMLLSLKLLLTSLE